MEEALVSFRKWMDGLAVVPTIKAINDKMTAIVDKELDRTLPGFPIWLKKMWRPSGE